MKKSELINHQLDRLIMTASSLPAHLIHLQHAREQMNAEGLKGYQEEALRSTSCLLRDILQEIDTDASVIQQTLKTT